MQLPPSPFAHHGTCSVPASAPFTGASSPRAASPAAATLPPGGGSVGVGGALTEAALAQQQRLAANLPHGLTNGAAAAYATAHASGEAYAAAARAAGDGNGVHINPDFSGGFPMSKSSRRQKHSLCTEVALCNAVICWFLRPQLGTGLHAVPLLLCHLLPCMVSRCF